MDLGAVAQLDVVVRPAAHNDQVPPTRRHVRQSGQQRLAASSLAHAHPAGAIEAVGEGRSEHGRHVLDDDRAGRISWQLGQQFAQGFGAAG